MQKAPPKPKKVFLSLAVRITIPVVALVAAVTVAVYLGLVHQARVTLLDSKEVAAAMVVNLTSTSIMPAVVFADDQGMQRALDDLARNSEITDVELWGFDGTSPPSAAAPLAAFHRTGGNLGRPLSPERQLWLEGDSVRLVEPVVNPDGQAVAAVTARVSTAREATLLAELARQILLVSAATALCLVISILWVINRIVVRPVKRLQAAAEKLAHGQADTLVAGRSSARVEDEVVRLAATFGEMAEAVRDREARLGVRNAELKLILDSVQQGFLTALPDGRLLPERSAILDTWFGVLGPDEPVWDAVSRIDARASDWFQSAWTQLLEGVFPPELSVDQLPKRLQRAGQNFDVAYHLVWNGKQLDRVVMVLTDVTAAVEHQRTLAEQHEFSALVDQFVRDRRAFRDFWQEATRLIRDIVADQGSVDQALKRDIHTLKGNARFFGLNRLSAMCHSIEDKMQERADSAMTSAERNELRDLWESLRKRMDPLMQGVTSLVEVSREDYQRLLDAVRQRTSFEQLEQLVRGLRREPTAWRLERAKECVKTACSKLGKPMPQILISDADLRLPPGPWAPFWSVLPHVLNNAADHGIDTPEERQAGGKPIEARVWLSTTLQDGELLIEVKDDGRGIDWDKVRDLAAQRGLPTQSQDDLTRALLTDGFSLKDAVTEVSGRGVGLAAVQNVVSAMGGRIELDSTAGVGTSWKFWFPIGEAGGSDADDDAADSATLGVNSRARVALTA